MAVHRNTHRGEYSCGFVKPGSVAVLSALVALAGSLCQAAEPSNKEKIVGTWEVAKSSDPDKVPLKSTFEFHKEGKFKINFKQDEQVILLEGTYTVDGETVNMTPQGAEGKEAASKLRITKLTETDLVIERKNDKKTVTVEFKKK